MPTYRVTYAHDREDAKSETEKHGWGMREVVTDDEVTNADQVIEIARTIGKEEGYTSVGISKIELLVDENAKKQGDDSAD